MGSHHKRNEGMKPVRRMAAKPKPEKKPRSQELDSTALAILSLQQTFLSTLQAHFDEIISDKAFEKKLQVIKGHFYRREFSDVFDNPEYCLIYAVRYLPSRALAYADLFCHSPILDLLYPPPAPRRPSEKKSSSSQEKKRIVAVGAGVGSELCALHLLPQMCLQRTDPEDEDMLEVLDSDLEIDVVDSADYSKFLSTLNTKLHSSNQTRCQGRLTFNYHRQDVLKYSADQAFEALLAETTLLTFMFVFNELFASSKSQTMQLIAAVAKHLPCGSHVLLIESAGDLSQVKLTSATQQVKFEDEGEKTEDGRSMMVYKFWDHLPGFEQVISEDRRWFRLHPSLKYSLDMEHVGYFVRLYRKIS